MGRLIVHQAVIQTSDRHWELSCLLVLQKAGDRGSLARASGDYVIVVAHNPDAGITRVKLPSGAKKVCAVLIHMIAVGVTSLDGLPNVALMYGAVFQSVHRAFNCCMSL